MPKNKFLQYLTSEKRFSNHTIKSYTTDLTQFNTYIETEFDSCTELEEINYQMIRSWVASMLERKISPRSINRKISTLKSYFKFLLRNGFLAENPMLKIVSPKVKKRLPVFIDQAQIEELLNEVEFETGFVGERDKLIIELFYVTGIRLSELINIQISDINCDEKIIKVLGKRNKERLIPLSFNMVTDLSNFIDKYALNTYLFTNLDGKKLYAKLVYRVVKKYNK